LYLLEQEHIQENSQIENLQFKDHSPFSQIKSELTLSIFRKKDSEVSKKIAVRNLSMRYKMAFIKKKLSHFIPEIQALETP